MWKNKIVSKRVFGAGLILIASLKCTFASGQYASSKNAVTNERYFDGCMWKISGSYKKNEHDAEYFVDVSRGSSILFMSDDSLHGIDSFVDSVLPIHKNIYTDHARINGYDLVRVIEESNAFRGYGISRGGMNVIGLYEFSDSEFEYFVSGCFGDVDIRWSSRKK